MISLETTKEVVKGIRRWQKTCGIGEREVKRLLSTIGKVEGNQSFKSSIWAIYCEHQDLPDDMKYFVMRTKAGITLPPKRK